MKFDPGARFEVVTCLQVLEHLDNKKVRKFAKKLLRHSTDMTIISVPFMWEDGLCQQHLQDPIDLKKLTSWTGIEPSDHFIVVDGTVKRLVAKYKKQ